MKKREAAVSLRGITKRFDKVVANYHVTLDIYKGEILSLLGENGSGKTTLMNMLSGIYYPDEGQILINGKEVIISSPKDAFELGIGMVHQHFKLIDVFTAAQNIILGLDGKLNLKEATAKIREICNKYGFQIDLNKKIYDMSVSEKQTVEIVKVLYRGADILILDEPTAVLTPQETEKLFAVMRNMKNDDKAIVIITHKLNEVEEISDRVGVLRHGEFIGDKPTSKTDAHDMTNMMVGHEVTLNIDRPEPVNTRKRLEVDGLTVVDEEGIVKLKDVSFTVNTGEILGIAGISGCGQKELLKAIAGLQPIHAGSIRYIHKSGEIEELVNMNPRSISDLGIKLSFVPEDRLGMGLVGNMNLTENMMLRSYRTGKSSWFVDKKAPQALAADIVKQLEVSTPSLETPVRKLSGGNVQKILVGREISSNPRVLMMAYVVRGLDINSSYTIYDLINKQKASGTAVIFVGEDLDVLLELCDRILVLCDGEVSGIVDGRTATKNQLGMMMTRKGEV